MVEMEMKLTQEIVRERAVVYGLHYGEGVRP